MLTLLGGETTDLMITRNRERNKELIQGLLVYRSGRRLR